MQITRIINNNIVISEDNSHSEVVLMGRGLGFQRHPGDVIDSDKVEKTYIMKDHGMTHRFQQMVAASPLNDWKYVMKLFNMQKTLCKRISMTIFIFLSQTILILPLNG